MAVSADSIYSETLQSIVDAKLEELVRKRKDFESSKALIWQTFSQQPDEAERIRILKDGIRACFKLKDTPGAATANPGVNSDLIQLLQNLDQFLEQPRYDPSLSSYQLQVWASSLGQYLDVQSNRYEFASLYAKLVTEWLASEKRLGNKTGAGDAQMSESFEELESSAKLRSRQEWEELIFQPAQTDAAAMTALLDRLFTSGKELPEALKNLREAVRSFEISMTAPSQFNVTTVTWAAKGLLSGDLLSEDKRTVLRDFLSNNVILSEVADVLNLRMMNIDHWTWGATVPVVQERKLAGQYSIYMQEDLLQAIFLQYIGVMWSVFWKEKLIKLVQTPGAWASSQAQISGWELRRRRYYLGHVRQTKTVNSKRDSIWLNRYFMTQLLDSPYDTIVDDDGAEEAMFGGNSVIQSRTMQTARKSVANKASGGSAYYAQAPGSMGRDRDRTKRKRMSAAPRNLDGFMEADDDDNDDDDDDDDDQDDDDESYSGGHSSISLKQGLLHLLRTEILINRRIHGDLTGFRAQFKSWNSLLPHNTILVVAEYLGVSEVWLKFFRSFLEAPLGFTVDGTVEEARIRRRGVPGSHSISDVLGEMILFCLDLAVNKSTGGQKLWRVHDDLWFWSIDHAKATQAWSTIVSFCRTMGLSLDTERVGSVRVSMNPEAHVVIDDSLPRDNIRWGFLYLDSKSGQWEIDEKLVIAHTDELRNQLGSKGDSVLSWVQAWNAYANTFFTTNFGQPARCFGRAHTQKVLLALEKVQRRLFNDGSSASVVDHLKAMLERRFNISDVPEGYCFFPTELGGLGLQNPFVRMLLVHETSNTRSDPEVLLSHFEQAEREAYEKFKKKFEEEGDRRPGAWRTRSESDDQDNGGFMSFEEFARHRETLNYKFDNNLRQVYDELLEASTPHHVVLTPDMQTALNLMDKGGIISQSSTINGNWHIMTAYYKWITQMYGPEIVKRFGGLNIVDNGVLPIGMVSLFRSDRVKWKA